jgi:DNA-binding CsgD family transcriptional regulator
MANNKAVLAYDTIKKPRRRPRKLYFQNRRNKVAELRTKGMSLRAIAEELGISKTTVARDVTWLESHEHMLRAQDVAEEIVEGQLMVIDEPLPTSLAEFRSLREESVILLLSKKKTYREVADELGIGINTVVKSVNNYLAEYGDWGGRTLEAWRNSQLMQIQEQMVRLQEDMATEPIGKQTEDGDEAPGWDLSPYQAAVIRDKARQRYTDLLAHESRLLSLLVQRSEVDINEKSVVVHVQGVDFEAWQRGRD